MSWNAILMWFQSLNCPWDVNKQLIKSTLCTRKFYKMNRVVINGNIIVKPWKLGSCTTKSVGDIRKDFFLWWKNVSLKRRIPTQCGSFGTKICMENNVFPKSIIIKNSLESVSSHESFGHIVLWPNSILNFSDLSTFFKHFKNHCK